jgi:hypothetical protein
VQKLSGDVTVVSSILSLAQCPGAVFAYEKDIIIIRTIELAMAQYNDPLLPDTQRNTNSSPSFNTIDMPLPDTQRNTHPSPASAIPEAHETPPGSGLES